MAQNYSYPRVSISTTALKHANAQPVAVDTTILFVPMLTEKGPAKEVYPVHSLAEFVDVFGELDYKKYGRTALNVANWLTNGGTVYMYRLVANDTAAKYKHQGQGWDITADAKYAGYYYYGLQINVSKKENSSRINIIIKRDGVVLESFSCLHQDINKVIKGSSYIKNLVVPAIYKQDFKFDVVLQLKGELPNAGFDGNNEELVKAFWKADNNGITPASLVLANHLEVPVDLIMDAGYDLETKKSMADFIAGDAAVRPDIIGIFELFDGEKDQDALEGVTKANNIAVYAQHFTVEHNDEDILVGPSYFLSQLLPYNDNMYGIQWATAGVRRGILEGVKKISENPTPAKMEAWFGEEVNYVQKTSRECSFMSQRTYEAASNESFTALSFLNNVRVLHKIRRDLERIAREYLFQFNDAMTIANMNEVLNKYIAAWIANRTLSSASVVAAKNKYSDEAVDVSLTMRFTGTIEVISVDIVVE